MSTQHLSFVCSSTCQPQVAIKVSLIVLPTLSKNSHLWHLINCYFRRKAVVLTAVLYNLCALCGWHWGAQLSLLISPSPFDGAEWGPMLLPSTIQQSGICRRALPAVLIFNPLSTFIFSSTSSCYARWTNKQILKKALLFLAANLHWCQNQSEELPQHPAVH